MTALPANLPPSPAEPSTRSGRFTELDGLRGVAILMVMIHHFTVVEPTNLLDRWLGFTGHYGWVGVDLFFVLSGFLITGILLDSRGRDRYFTSFYARRVLRIFPVYFAVLVAALVVLPQLMPGRFAVQGDDPYEWTYWCFLSNWGMAWENAFHNRLLAPTWSLAIEEQFYLVWPLVVLLVPRRGLMVLCPLLIIASFALRMLMLHAWDTGHITIYVATPGRLDGLAAGAWVAAALRGGWDPRPWAGKLAALAITCIVAAFLVEAWQVTTSTQSVYLRGDWGLGPGIALWSVAGAAMVSLLVATEALPAVRRMLDWSMLQSLGKYSFAIYLTHMPLRSAIRDIALGPGGEEGSPLVTFAELSTNPWVGQVVFYLLASVASWCVGWLSWHLLESRVLALKRYFPY